MGETSATQGEMRVTAEARTSNDLTTVEDIKTSAVLGLEAHADTFVSGYDHRFHRVKISISLLYGYD
jgi:hypothetical protein